MENQSYTKEQLFEYVKRQKLKIKKLEKDIESLKVKNDSLEAAAASGQISADKAGSDVGWSGMQVAHGSSVDSMVFWPMISRQTAFLQQLSKSAILAMISRFNHLQFAAKSILGKSGIESLHKSFSLWRMNSMQIRLNIAKQKIENLEAKVATSEQKISKLKVLLSKTHQANQRNLENTNAYKKAGEDVQMELYNLKQKESSEKQSLMDALRIQSLESAFQYDMELTIQRAAEAMIQQQQQQLSQSNAVSQSKKTRDFESENAQLSEQMKELQQQISNLNEQQLIVQNNLKESVEKVAFLQKELEDSQFVSKQLRKSLKEEVELREEVELELSATLSNKVKMLREIEIATENKFYIVIDELKKELSDLTLRLETSDRATRLALSEKELVAAELQKANLFAVDLSNARNEIRLLEKTNSELKKSLSNILAKTGTIPSSTDASAETASNSATAVKAIGNAKPTTIRAATAINSDASSSRILKNQEVQTDSSLLLPTLDAKELLPINATVKLYSNVILTLLKFIDHSQNEWKHSNAQLVGQFMKVLKTNGNSSDEQIRTVRTFIDSIIIDIERSFESVGRNLLIESDSDTQSICGGILEKIEKQIAMQKEELNKLIILQESSNNHSKQLLGGARDALIFEASSVTIPAGRDLVVPIPMHNANNVAGAQSGSGSGSSTLLSKAVLEWVLTGDSASSLELQLEVSEGKTLLLVSRQSDTSDDLASVIGSHSLQFPSNSTAKVIKMKLRNSAMWGAATISYKITLREDNPLPQQPIAVVAHSQWEEATRKSQIAELISRRERLVNVVETLRGLQRSWKEIRSSLGNDLVTSVQSQFASLVDAQTAEAVQRIQLVVDRTQSPGVNAEDSHGSGHILIARPSKATSSSSSPRYLRSQIPLPPVAVDNSGSSVPSPKSSTLSPTSSSSTTFAFPLEPVESTLETTVFSCESLFVRASSDFRLPIPLKGISRPATLSWDFCVPKLVGQAKHVIGFAVLEKRPDGSLPQLVPYSKVSVSGHKGSIVLGKSVENDVVVLFDNTFSWLQEKEVSYQISLTFEKLTPPKRVQFVASNMVTRNNDSGNSGVVAVSGPADIGDKAGASQDRRPPAIDTNIASSDLQGSIEASPALVKLDDLEGALESMRAQSLKETALSLERILQDPQVITNSQLSTETLARIRNLLQQTLLELSSNGEFLVVAVQDA